jgi:hypothetical protein
MSSQEWAHLAFLAVTFFAFFSGFGLGWWIKKKSQLDQEMSRGAFEAGAKWLEEWKAEGKPVSQWPGNEPPPYYWARYWNHR